MSSDKLVELNNALADGFFFNNLASLAGKNISLEEKDINTIESALRYIDMIKMGMEELKKDYAVEMADEPLEAYRNAINALYKSLEKLTMNRFLKIINNAAEELEEARHKKKIISENMKNTYKLFNAIRSLLIKRSRDMIKTKDQKILDKF